jgi:hypothetical protein
MPGFTATSIHCLTFGNSFGAHDYVKMSSFREERDTSTPSRIHGENIEMTNSTRQTLTSVLPRLRKRIEKIQTRNENIGEQNTKAALIDPLLAALGWDVEDIDEVSREYRRKSQDNPVDYALFMLRSPRLFVEAKGLEKDLSDRKWISQVLGYATVVGVEWCVLTNGDEYRLYNAHAPVDVEQKLFRVIRISESDQEYYTSKL